MLARVFKAFQYRDFRLLWLGAFTSSVGTWMQKLAQAWLVLQISDSPFLLGLDAFLGDAPILLFSLLGGVAADRRDRRHLLLASQITQMTSAFVLTLLVALGVVKVWHILCLSFLTGLGQAFGGPAYQALLPSLVDTRDLSNAIAMNSIQFNLARVVGPVLGGLALNSLGAQWCFGLNGLSFLAVIVSLLAIRIRFVPEPGKQTLLASLGHGLKFVRGHGALPSLVALAFSMALLGLPLVVFLPVFARDVYHQGAGTFTLLLSVYGAGSIGGALGVAALGYVPRKGRYALGFLISLGGAMALFAVSDVIALSCAFLLLAGGCLVGVLALISSLVQEIVEDTIRGRVMSVYTVAFRGGMPLGSLLTGALVPRFGAPLVLAVNGMALACLGAYLLFVHRRVAAL